MALEHQDWKPVIIRTNIGKNGKMAVGSTTHNANSSHVIVINTNKSKNSVMHAASSKPAWKIENEVDGEAGKPLKYVSKEDAQKIIQGRLAKKLKQKQLAQMVNMNEKDVVDIESCKAVENKMVLAKIKKFLGI